MSRRFCIVISVLTTSLAACARVVVVDVPKVEARAGGAQKFPDRTPGQEGTNGKGTPTNAATTDGQAEPQPTAPGGALATPVTGEGVFYALPRTVVQVLLKADQTVTQSARFARFAPIFTPGLKPPCGSIADCAKLDGQPGKQTVYSIQQGATFSTFGEPDPKKVYMVKFADERTLDQTIAMTWSESGLLSNASASVTNRTTDVVVAGIKLATSLATKAAAAGGPVSLAMPNEKGCPASAGGAQGTESPNDAWIIPILRLAEGDAARNALVANYCDLPPVGADADSRDDFRQQRDEAALRAAMRAYLARVAQMVEQRSNVLNGTANVLDPIPYLDRLDALIDEQMKALFVGSKSTKTWELPFEVRDFSENEGVELLKYHATGGVCPFVTRLAHDVKPAPDGVPTTACPSDSTLVTMTLRLHPERESQLFHRIQTGVQLSEGERSFRYVIPAQVRADVMVGSTSHGAAVFAVAQFGHVAWLPARRNSKALSYELAMIEATGALKSFKIASTGVVDAGTIDAISGAGGTVLDARKARLDELEKKQKAAETAADELTILTRQHQLLKLKDDICTLQKKYGLACDVQP